MLRARGKLVCVGLPVEPMNVPDFNIVFTRKCIAGSLIGGLPETQEMLDYCADHNITADMEVIPIQEIQNDFKRMLASDVKYRFVVDIALMDA